MIRPAYRSMLWGLGLLAAALMLLELLTFRLCAAAIGQPVAAFAAITTPALAGLAAAITGWRSAGHSPQALARRAAHLATIGGAFVALGAIGITWASQEIAHEKGYGTWLHVGVAVASCALGPMLVSSAAALAMRRLLACIGRAGFAMGVGGALGALLVPLVMGTLGAPRGLICVGAVCAGAAFVFGRAAGEVEPRPRWSLMATLPLVVTSLVSGDYGEPWMKVRTDLGRRSKVDHEVWTSQGVFAVSNVTKMKARMGIDRHRTVPFGRKQKTSRTPRFVIVDLPFLLNSSKGDRGPALVIGSGSGRYVEAALAYGHPRVDVVEQDRRVVDEMLLSRYDSVSDGLYRDERVKLLLGDGRGQLAALGSDYEHILIGDKMRVDQAAPRFIAHQDRDRLFTHSAIREYLSHLRPGGTVLMRLPFEGGTTAIRSAIEALPNREDAPKQVLACHHEEYMVILVSSTPRSPSDLQKLTKKCKRGKGSVAYPLDEIKRGRRDYDKLVAERNAEVAALEATATNDDDKPFLVPAPTLGGIRGEAVAAFHGLRPMPEPAPPATKGTKPAQSFVEPPTTAGLAALCSAIGLLLVFVVFLIPTGSAGGGAPIALRLAFPFFGLALAASLFSLNDTLMRMMGTGLAGWSLIVPLGLVGAGSGRLAADTFSSDPKRLRRVVMMASVVALVWMLVMFGLTPTLAALGAMGGFTKALLALFVIVSTGALLGFPLAAGLKMLQGRAPEAVAWSWGAHLAGWGLGGAVALLATTLLGVRNLWLVSVSAFAVGAGLLALTPQRSRSPAGNASLAPAE